MILRALILRIFRALYTQLLRIPDDEILWRSVNFWDKNQNFMKSGFAPNTNHIISLLKFIDRIYLNYKFRMEITSILEWTSKTGQHSKWSPRSQKELFWFRCLITQESQKNPEAWSVNFFAKTPTLFKIQEILMKMEIRSVQFKLSEYFCINFS